MQHQQNIEQQQLKCTIGSIVLKPACLEILNVLFFPAFNKKKPGIVQAKAFGNKKYLYWF